MRSAHCADASRGELRLCWAPLVSISTLCCTALLAPESLASLLQPADPPADAPPAGPAEPLLQPADHMKSIRFPIDAFRQIQINIMFPLVRLADHMKSVRLPVDAFRQI